MPSMWVFPDERRQIFEGVKDEEHPNGVVANGDGEKGIDAGDGGDLIEISGRDLARRCLELIGEEIGLSSST